MSEESNVSLASTDDHTVEIEDVNTNNVKRLKRQLRVAGIADVSDSMSTKLLSISKVNALRASVDKHNDAVAKVLLTSRDSLDKKSIIESAFRACKEAFVEVSLDLINLLEAKKEESGLVISIKKVVEKALDKININGNHITENADKPIVSAPRSYAAVAGASGNKIRLPHGKQIEIQSETSFFVVPDKHHVNKYTSAQATKEVTCKVLKPSDYGLRINRISLARNNAVRISADSPDIDRLKTHPGLKMAGLEVIENIKFNPRLMVRGIPTGMSAEEIREELILQNFNANEITDLKVIYVFPARDGRKTTSCVLEVSAGIRNVLKNKNKLYLRYSVCSVSDYVWIRQCYRCLAFGHLARNCESQPKCGHCAEAHEMKNCKVRKDQPKCGNCMRTGRLPPPDLIHSAFDTKNCPILVRKFKERIADTNYEQE